MHWTIVVMVIVINAERNRFRHKASLVRFRVRSWFGQLQLLTKTTSCRPPRPPTSVDFVGLYRMVPLLPNFCIDDVQLFCRSSDYHTFLFWLVSPQ